MWRKTVLYKQIVNYYINAIKKIMILTIPNFQNIK